MLKKYNLIFVVLVYGNTNDLVEFIESTKIINGTSKIVVVNSYLDDSSMKKCNDITKEYDCDFINVENKGYGAGNNVGIEYAKTNYDFDFLVVSNPDIIIKKFDFECLKLYKHNIVGPKIITSTGKNQNPFYTDKKIFASAEYHFLKTRNKIGYYSIIAMNKCKKMLFFTKLKVSKQCEAPIYAVHGSCIIFSKYAIDLLNVVFDENIFLFCEEMVLAEEMKRKGISAYYTDRIEVYHKEDGSMKFLSGSMYDEEVKSNGYVLKKYYS